MSLLQPIKAFGYTSRESKAHFGLPWVRPWDNRGKCMDRKMIQCLSNASQHVPIYLQPFPSNSTRKFKNSPFLHIFCTFWPPLGTPLGQSRQWRIQNFIMGADGRVEVGRKNEFLPETGCFWCILGLLFTFMQKLVRSTGRHILASPGYASVTIAVYVTWL